MTYPTDPQTVTLNIRPNWKDGFKETLEWKTDVKTSHSGKEQRRSVRRVPRRSFEYNYDAFGLKAQIADNLLWGHQNRTYLVPVWSDKSPLRTAAAVSDVTLDVDTTLYSFKVGGGIVITFDGENEIAVIDSMDDNSITMTLPLTRAWPARSNVTPAVAGHLPTSLSGTRSNDVVKSGTLMITTSPEQTTAFLPDTPVAALTFEGIEVLTVQPNWSGAITISDDFQFDVVDFEVGPINWFPTEAAHRVTRGYSWLLESRTQIMEYRAFLKRLEGRLKPVYIPSWTQDFTVTSDYAVAANRLYVLENSYGELLEGSPDRSLIMIRMNDGSKVIRRIVGFDSGIGGSWLVLDTPLSSDVSRNAIKAVHFMMKHRLASDALTIQWMTDTIAVVQTAFITIPSLELP